jgi:hypothetical protein
MPSIANEITNILDTSITLNKAGRVLNTDSTTIFNPSFLLMTLSGLRALKALNDLSALSDPILDVSAIYCC